MGPMNGWWDDVYTAALDTYKGAPIAKVFASLFFFSFWVNGVLVAYNIFVAFCISAYQVSRAGADTDIWTFRESQAMKKKREELRMQGTLIHIRPSTALVRHRIIQEVFTDDGDDQDASIAEA